MKNVLMQKIVLSNEQDLFPASIKTEQDAQQMLKEDVMSGTSIGIVSTTPLRNHIEYARNVLKGFDNYIGSRPNDMTSKVRSKKKKDLQIEGYLDGRKFFRSLLLQCRSPGNGSKLTQAQGCSPFSETFISRKPTGLFKNACRKTSCHFASTSSDRCLHLK
ncbi:unnamed protein product [Albugo candida]|uniref:Uncharacterized protein n=1 Tax=Albugo candida TaxID=65357 RepID=A0A024FTC7_9STRA|nr:unnamed protein product [Albugo candida]|eukprot:CCI10266.1 unnamed protein product [Albugo candida]